MNRTSRSRQSGSALLIMMLAVLAAMSAILVSGLSRDGLENRRQVDTRKALAEARDVLIDYALTQPDIDPAKSYTLPCPDIDAGAGFAAGESHTSACGASGETVIGRLPWRTLGIAPLKDSAAACLWYVVSGSWKDAAGQTAAMINTDSNGQLQLHGVETASIIEGVNPDERVVAMVVAGMSPLGGQSHPATGFSCDSAAAASEYLDVDLASGVSNASISGMPDVVDVLAVAASANSQHNDRIATISRKDIADRIQSRSDFEAKMRSLGLVVSACLADYGKKNGAGINDKRLPWPTTRSLSDYRVDSAYDDVSGLTGGRLPDVVDDSSAETGNSIARVLTDCDATAVPAWTPEMAVTWRHWKDHFFYVVADPNLPSSAIPSSCGACLTVNGAGQYAAVVVFANSRLSTQSRSAPPTDTDSKQYLSNYLEGRNLLAVNGATTDFESAPASPSFNDRLFCVEDSLVVTDC